MASSGSAVASRHAIYRNTSSCLLAALLILLLAGVVGSMVLFFHQSGSEWKMWLSIACVFIVVTLIGAASKTVWPAMLFAQDFRRARDRGGLVCPYDGCDMSRIRIGDMPHELVQCPVCARIAGEVPLRAFWSDYKEAAEDRIDDFLIIPGVDASWWKPSRFVCPVDGSSLIPLGETPAEASIGACKQCGCLVGLQSAVRAYALRENIDKRHIESLQSEAARFVIPYPESS